MSNTDPRCQMPDACQKSARYKLCRGCHLKQVRESEEFRARARAKIVAVNARRYSPEGIAASEAKKRAERKATIERQQAADRQRECRLRKKQKMQSGQDRVHSEWSFRAPPAEVLAEASRVAAAPRELRHRLCGDPLPGRSALDHKRGIGHG